MPNKWNLPGGGVGRKEKPRDAARREAREEAGVKLGKLKKIGKFNIGDKEDLHVYHAHGHEGTPEHNFESKKLRWVHHSRAHKMRVVPSLKKILKHFSQKHAKKMFKE